MKLTITNLAIYLFLFIICFFLYFNALNNDFIFDDNFLIVKNLYIKNISLIPKLFKTDIFHFQHPEDSSLGIYYRPLQALSYSFDYFFWKLNPSGYRLVNIVIQSINGLLLYLLICLIFKDKILALLSAIFFCIHPIQVSDVTFISVRAVLLETLFMLLSLITLINYFLYQRRINYFLSILSFILALLFREGALLLPLFIVACAIILGIDKKRLFFNLLPFIFVCIAYLLLRSQFIPCDKFYITNVFSLKRLGDFFHYLGYYFQQLILPIAFQAILFKNYIIFKFILFTLTIALIAFFLIKAIIFKNKIAVFGFIFYLLGLLPIIKLLDTIPYFGTILSEHYAYIASIGFCVLISYFILILHSHFKMAANVLIVIIISIYSTLTVVNNTNYKDELTFYNHILTTDEKHTFIRINLGTLYYEKKNYDEAIKQANLVLTVQPDAWDAYLLLGNVFKDKGNLNKAMELYKKTLILYPRSSEAFNNIALIYKAWGRDKEAYESFKKALQINPEFLMALRNFIDFLIEKRLYVEVIPFCEKILELSPEDVDARIRIGIILAELGYFKEAEVVFKEVLKLSPASVEAMRNLGVLYANMGDFDKAISLWEKALDINPYDKGIKNDIEEAKRLLGK